jgi:hypothetical protein
VSTGSVVYGFDLSPDLIDSARSRERSDERAIGFEIAEMATATGPEEPYDQLVSRFGIMFFDDPLAALANLARAWRPVRLCGVGPSGRKSVHDKRTPSGVRNHRLAAARSRSAGAVPLCRCRQVAYSAGSARSWRARGLPAAEAANSALASFASFGELLAEAGNEALNDARQSLTARLSRWELEVRNWSASGLRST